MSPVEIWPDISAFTIVILYTESHPGRCILETVDMSTVNVNDFHCTMTNASGDRSFIHRNIKVPGSIPLLFHSAYKQHSSVNLRCKAIHP